MASYIFDGRDINVKSVNAVYELTNIFDIDLDRVILSALVKCNKNGKQYVIGYKRMDDNIVPLYVKSPLNCYSNGVITWGGQFKTNFRGVDILFSSCVKATTVLKIANIYKQNGGYHPQVFVKEFKIVENRSSAKSFLDDFEASPSFESSKSLLQSVVFSFIHKQVEVIKT